MNAADQNDPTSGPPPFAGVGQPGAGAPPAPPPAPPRLTRSTDDKVVSGLCGGLGRHFGVDPVVFRIAFVVTALAGGSGVLLYLVGWLLVPDDRSGATMIDRARHGHRSQVLGAVLLGAGAIILLDRLGDNGGGGRFGGLVLLGVGAAVLWSRRDQSTPPLPPVPPGPGPVPPPAPWAPPPPQPLSPPAPGHAESPPAPDQTDELPPSEVATSEVATSEVPTSDVPSPESSASATRSVDSDTATAVLAPAPGASTPPPDQPPAGAPPWPPAARRARTRRPHSVLVAVTLSLLAILGGGLALLAATGTDIPVAVGLALGLLVVGVALVVGAWRGRARWLIPLGVILGVAVMAASAVDVPIRGGIGDRTYRPRAASELQTPYRLAAGDLVVDLTRLDLSGATEKVTASVAAGQLEVIVPDGPEVIVDAHVGAGSMTVFGRQSDGNGKSRNVVEPGREGGGRLILSARTGFGDLEVRRASA